MTTISDAFSSKTYSDLIGTLDLQTKVRLLTGADAWSTAAVESIGLGAVRVSDGPGGVRGPEFPGGRAVALFPNITLLASSWSDEASQEVGRLLAEEARIQDVKVVLGPTVNLHRSLLGGRVFEAFSEDPLLSGKSAAAFVRGLQESGIGACVKHLVGNESETNRNSMNSVIDEATLRELYLLPFEITITDADPWSLMAAYNDVNGVAATEHEHVNNEVVKGEWGYTGLIMSDWFATKTAGAAANGGLDLVMPGPAGPWGQALVDAVQAGEVDERVIDDHVARLLRLADRVGVLGQQPPSHTDLPRPDGPERREQLTRLAAQSMTVLTNRRSTLPLDRGQTVALIGRHAIETIGMGGGSAQVLPPYQVSVAEGLGALLGEGVTVVDGVEVRVRPVTASAPYMTEPETGEPGIQATFFAADGAELGKKHSRSPLLNIDLGEVYDDYITSIRLRTSTQLRGPVEVGVYGAGDWTVVGADLDFVLRLTGKGFGEQIIAPPAGSGVINVDTSGLVEAVVHLAQPMGVRRSDVTGDVSNPLHFLAASGAYGLTVRPVPRPVSEVIDAAAAAAANADVAVVVVGVTEEQETESMDKTTLRLPGEQDALIRGVAAAAKRTVVVVNTGTPALMPWADEVDAIIWVGLPGQEAGHAIAAALFGDIEPAGRLVTTFPTDDGQAPAWSVTPIDGNIEYSEGKFIGYRGHHAGQAPAPAFWLGHGLGYSTWDYSDAALSAAADVEVGVTVTNTGSRTSRETVQLYFQPAETSEPVRLVGWHGVTVAAGESARVEVRADSRVMRRWNTSTDSWEPFTGGGHLLLARGLGDVRATIDLLGAA